MVKQRALRAVGGIFLVGVLALGAPPGVAQDDEIASPGGNDGKITLSGGFDIVTEYWFRGLAQENAGFIIQPYAGVGINLYEDERSEFSSLDFNIATWNSLHDNARPNQWFESDFSLGISADVGPTTLSIDYTTLYNPTGGGIFAEEIALGLGIDDQEITGLDTFGLNPAVKLIFETDGGSDGKGAGVESGPFPGDLGTYLEFSAAPTVTLNADSEYSVDLSLPIVLGLGLANYYEDVTGDDDVFGYIDIGIALSVPLAFIPEEYGVWSVNGHAHLLVLGDAAANISGPMDFGITDGKEVEAWGGAGIAMEY